MMITLILTLISADFPVCTAAGFNGYPSICYANDQYYVFWIDHRQSPNYSIYGARITKDGTILDPNGTELYTDSAGYDCNVASDGTNLLVLTRNHC